MDPIPFSPPYSMELAMRDMMLNCEEIIQQPRPVPFVYSIPHTVPDENLVLFYMNTKTKLEKYRVTTTLNRADRTMTFFSEDNARSPGPGLNKHGKLEHIISKVPFPKKRATKLKHVWPDLEASFNDFGISCDLNLDECTMQVSTTPVLKNPHVFDGARNLIQLLSTSIVPPLLAIEMVQGRRHEIIEIGYRQDGLCTRFRISKEEYHKRWETLFYSLKALSIAMQCHIFLDENTLTAVTAVESNYESISWDERIAWLKISVQDCIIKSLCPLTSIRKVGEEFGKDLALDDLVDLHAKHLELVKSDPSFIRDSVPEVCSLYALLREKRATHLLEASSLLESSLSDYGISCTLEKDFMSFTTIRCTSKPDIIDKAWQLLELLSTTHVPASLALEIMDGSAEACLIKIGNQEGGGMCQTYGINKEEYHVRWECLHHSLQAVAEIAHCNVFLNYGTVAAVGHSSLELVKHLVVNCILHNVCPGTNFVDYKFVTRGLDYIEDPHVKHMKMEKETSESWVCMLEVSSLVTVCLKEQVDELNYNWSIVESCFQKHGISCKLVADEFYMAVSVTTKAGESSILDKIFDVLKLLSFDIPPLKAIQVLEGGMYYDFIPTGDAYGGFCLKYGVTEKEFDEVVWPEVELGLEEIGRAMKCDVIISPHLITVCGPHNQIYTFSEFVEQCFETRCRPTFGMRVF